MRAPTDEQVEIQATCRDFLSRTSAPLRNDWTPGEVTERYGEFVKLGWPALAVPEANGGLGRSLPVIAAVCEELGRSLDPTPLVGTLAAAWSLAQEDGRHGSMLSMIESGGGVFTSSLASPPEQNLPILENASGSVSGTVRFVPTAFSSTHLVVATRDGDATTVCLVELGGERVKIREVRSADANRHFCEITLDSAEVVADSVLADGAAQRLFDVEVALRCAELVGLGRRALELSVAHASERCQFGRPIGSNQALQHRMADTLIDLESAGAAVAEAVSSIEDRSSRASIDVSIAKAWVGPVVSRACSDAIQIHGGMGFSWEYGLHQTVRRAKVAELLWGSTRWHRARVWDFASSNR
jgi:alkylation response protein AidB-like acyl-CoA dehydrogenase